MKGNSVIKVTKNILKDIYKPRSANVKKYDFGLLLVIGGSEFYSGSPALSALAAFRAGTDMVRVIAPKRAADIIASFSPNLAAYPLKGDLLMKEHLATLISMTESAKTVSNGNVAVVIGGGMGRSAEVQETILEYLSETSVPVVIDADAIHALAKKPDIIFGKKFLITPHTYEFFVLTGKEIYQLSEEEKIKAVQSEANRLQTTILLKGKTDIISDGKEVALNETGSPYMTKGGTGDTLAGICGGLLARGIAPFKAAQAAAYINGKAGEIVAQEKKEGLLATDLIEAIPEVLR
ncbi:MAG: NAD(P)H-hydrate dehydratase [Parcubacteria group bacterium CG1_02_39_15]|uniref:ADP-dependent (S)-NAD(P)H-hydrate dehydratase n=3 Tax=Bacteria candidate phyla TaxID=1783234 RepID=A0A2G9YS39_9BACT|nr:MAG: NAD(P)H-hydrate dehydratase [Parcubacteria group bacterium CG1_02_39_15]PIP22049.1 MAG: NAD(P)H-hydrate dehydratase [Candidatus Nealsonbacteria bacterium CG23_combo_of_CG06-09_8_20_14_all_39_25]PIZ88029.1 MAG: NAD(P)H-hydrate dehydratase [Candidatus Nealsonbacteria bacterium CG_4_10_14_0_2_um_filter_39_15]PJC68154.1 MAG: NAD(P)H-hydrate dehydratase [candidate division WWE3 bacterium CG_4_8_14_3_um_filter_42_11]